MQLLDLASNKLTATDEYKSDIDAERVAFALNDIATNVQIQSNFCISHPAYMPLEIPPELLSRFRLVPIELQNKLLSMQLQNFLYGIYYSASLKTVLTKSEDSEDFLLQQNLQNNTFLGVDLAFYNRLHESNCGQGYFDPDWSVQRLEKDGSLAVKKGDLTIHVDPDRHLHGAEKSAKKGDLVSVLMPRNLVQNGFYMAVGNSGSSKRPPPELKTDIVRIYFNLDPDGAAQVMEYLTRHINEVGFPFSFKALYNPSDYGRYDTAVLYFNREYFSGIRQILHQVYLKNKECFQESTPLFTKYLAPGVALAEEPNQKFSEVESFGMNRCQIVANGLLEAQRDGEESREGRLAFIHHHFSLNGIDLKKPYLNAGALDVYPPLEL